MYKLALVSALALFVVGCSTHQHSMFEEQDHFHSCDGSMVYVEEPVVDCWETLRDDIIEELRNSRHTKSHDFHHRHEHDHNEDAYG